MKHILLAIKKLSTVYGKKYRRTIFLLLLYAACGVISSIETVVLFCKSSRHFSRIKCRISYVLTLTRYLLTTRKCTGVSLAFAGMVILTWLGVQALEMDERTDSKNTQNGCLASSTVDNTFYQLGWSRKDLRLNTGTVK